MISADALLIAGAILVVGIAVYWMWVVSENRRKIRHSQLN